MRILLFISFLISVLAIVFALLNPDDVFVNFGFRTTWEPLSMLLIATFVLGVLAGVLAMLPGRLKRRREVRTLRKQVDSGYPVTPPSTSMSEV